MEVEEWLALLAAEQDSDYGDGNVESHSDRTMFRFCRRPVAMGDGDNEEDSENRKCNTGVKFNCTINQSGQDRTYGLSQGHGQ